MKITLTGLLDNGAPRRPGVVDPRRTVSFPRGSDVRLVVSVITPSGTPVPLSGAGVELLLSVKRRATEYPPRLVKKAVLSASSGEFTFGPGDTRWMQAGQWVYDIWLTKDGERNAVVPTAPFLLTESVAAIPSAPPPPILQFVGNDTEPLVLDFSGVDITGWAISVHLGYLTPLVKTAVLTDPLHGVAEVYWLPGDLIVGRWACEIQTTRPGPFVQTTDVFIADIRAEIA